MPYSLNPDDHQRIIDEYTGELHLVQYAYGLRLLERSIEVAEAAFPEVVAQQEITEWIDELRQVIECGQDYLARHTTDDLAADDEPVEALGLGELIELIQDEVAQELEDALQNAPDVDPQEDDVQAVTSLVTSKVSEVGWATYEYLIGASLINEPAAEPFVEQLFDITQRAQ